MEWDDDAGKAGDVRVCLGTRIIASSTPLGGEVVHPVFEGYGHSVSIR